MGDPERDASIGATSVAPARVPATVSVIIPTFNRASWVGRAIDSVLVQSLPASEVIVVDDGSTDDTRSLIRSRYPGVIYVERPNRGVSAARNVGIRRAGGDWLAFLDSDDLWLPSKLQLQMRALAGQPTMLVCHTDEMWFRNGRRVNPKRKHAKHGGWIFEHCLPLCCMSPSSIVIHREVFERVGLFDESLPVCEDYDLWLRLSARYPVRLVDEMLVHKYGGHADQLSRSRWGMDRFRIRALENLLATDVLAPGQREVALATVQAKLGIYLAGARKRGRRDEVMDYERKLERLSGTVVGRAVGPGVSEMRDRGALRRGPSVGP